MKIENAVALVTGANRGIGLAFANELLARGARKVYAAARAPPPSPSVGFTPCGWTSTSRTKWPPPQRWHRT
jgi:NAD(P)-dependent dehydrogenase (short-subunit alcohol dehydrogenase family)